MTRRPTAETRIATWLEAAAVDDAPDRILDATFARTRTIRQDARVPGWLGALRRDRRVLLLAAVVALAAAVGAAAAIGSWLIQQRQPDRDLLARITDAGFIRIGVRPDHPQAGLPTVGVDGFDVDVAAALAERLGVDFHVDVAPATELLSAATPPSWDIALPSVVDTAVDSSAFTVSEPYYYWPHYLLVDASANHDDAADLAGMRICVVAGDAGEAWLRGTDGSRLISAAVVVSLPSDRDCLNALDTGDVAGVVTAALGPADVAARPNLVSLPGPPWEGRAVIALRESRPEALIARVDAAISAMLADGSLGQLAKNRFGGFDVTTSPSP